MTIAVHLVNTPMPDVRQAYLDAWLEIDAQRLRHPAGRRLHVSWIVDDALHVVDVWDSAEQQEAFMRDLKPILDKLDMQIQDQPDVGEFVQIVQPPA
ncbi:MAG: hypothetical protein ACXVHC_02290 [Frankiaceae bacterium]